MDTKSQKENGNDKPQEEVESLQETSEAIQNRLGEFWETSKERAAACARQTDRAIRDNPWPVIGFALGVGLIVGLLLSRGDGDED